MVTLIMVLFIIDLTIILAFIGRGYLVPRILNSHGSIPMLITLLSLIGVTLLLEVGSVELIQMLLLLLSIPPVVLVIYLIVREIKRTKRR